ncbi:patatin-like phospholipase family protein [Adhaeribacter soli]|uniref:PNPLA domain-containing protein n=1 Tax=Adhaeribacter soli TaxID=2607655 RepID=A0A5N1J6U0_9BACT|nr:patatin-like phospholipase family protein [Adhaeribacter soli]KAA9340323.1 hypothetical protein F0P94_08230 [Adhaeribacter soli]
MKVEQFTGNAAILHILDELNEKGIKEKQFSDVVDDLGNQYVDLVQEGGGVLGIALAGYTYVLEQMDIRFLQLAGTSAGAINTMLMAAAGKVHEEKACWMLDKLANKNLSDFIDGDSDARDFVDVLLSGAGNLKIGMKGMQVIDNFRDDFGLNPGKNFHQWIKNILSQNNIKTLADLEKLREQQPDGGIKTRKGESRTPDRFKRVALITADITTETKVEFPRMAELYWENKEQVNPADFVRASMSIPMFFHPYKVSNIPYGPERWKKWKELAGYIGNIPNEVLFMDGGIMSNFPIDLFHNFSKVPDAPTFGVKLGLDRVEANKNDKFFGLLGSIFDSARHVHDYDFIMRNPDYKHLLCFIETGGHNWLNFNISDDDKVDLFIRGARAAAGFLQGFDWDHYKNIRAQAAKLYQYDKATDDQVLSA